MQDFMNRFRSRLTALFRGRYGIDSLSKAPFVGAAVSDILGMLTGGWLGSIFRLLFWAGLIISVLRIFSGDYTKRVAENKRYLAEKEYVRAAWALRKTHRVYKCPHCGTLMKVPKGAGNVRIRCRNCGEEFTEKA